METIIIEVCVKYDGSVKKRNSAGVGWRRDATETG